MITCYSLPKFYLLTISQKGNVFSHTNIKMCMFPTCDDNLLSNPSRKIEFIITSWGLLYTLEYMYAHTHAHL